MHGHACTNCNEAYPGFEPRCLKCDPPPMPACGHITSGTTIGSPLASFSQAGHTLTDADIERIARRVVEMLDDRHRETARLCSVVDAVRNEDHGYLRDKVPRIADAIEILDGREHRLTNGMWPR